MKDINKSKILLDILYKPYSYDSLRLIRSKTASKLALVTGSKKYEIDFLSSDLSKTAKFLSPNDFFDYIVTHDDIAESKPHAESYQKVIDFFKIEPNRMLVFEDSLIGVTSAKAAGAAVVAIKDKNSIKDWGAIQEKADYTVDDWEYIKEMIYE